MVCLLHYLYSLSTDFYTLENLILIDLIGYFFNNGPKIFEINCQSLYISYINIRVRIYYIF
jgi:GTP-binding protein EngB required for normal cell division